MLDERIAFIVNNIISTSDAPEKENIEATAKGSAEIRDFLDDSQ